MKRIYKLASFLFERMPAVYRWAYFWFKHVQDQGEISLLRKHVGEGHRVLDIGANIGFYSVLLARLVGPSGRVTSFEPDPKNYGLLEKNAGSHANVTMINKAVGAATGILSLHRSDEINVDHRMYDSGRAGNSIQVQVTTIDDSVQHPVDFIKMDIQGYEPQAFQGMTRTLEKNPGVKILAEFWPHGLKLSGSSAEACQQIVARAGFYVYLVEGQTLTPLSADDARAMNDLGEEEYFNIFATRTPLTEGVIGKI